MPHGRMLRPDADGYLVPDVDPSTIVGPWRALCDAVVALYRGHLGDQLHSVYVRGSVARGLAVPGLSDLDSWALVRGLDDDAFLAVQPWMEPAGDALTARFAVVTGVELCLTDIDRLYTPRGRFARVLLALQAVCLHGTDITTTLPRVRPDRSAWGPLWHVRGASDGLLAELDDGLPDEDVGPAFTWLAKTLVRAAFELVMAREQGWTRDLQLCAASVARWEPRWGEVVGTLAAQAIDPPDDPEVLRQLCSSELVSWLVRESLRHKSTDGVA